MHTLLAGHRSAFLSAALRFIAAVLIVCLILLPSCTATDTGAGSTPPARGGNGPVPGFFLGFASLQVATKAPVNISVNTVTTTMPVKTFQTAATTGIFTTVPTVAPQVSAVTPASTAAITQKSTPLALPVKTPSLAVATLRPFATAAPAAFSTMPVGTIHPYCISPFSSCNGSCTDTRTDRNNCGACSHQCPAGSNCQNGTCLLPCGNGFVDSDSDPNNCGGCGHACAYGICCNGHCVNWDEFDANCGECGKACQNGMVCAFGPGWFDCEYHCQLPDGRDYWIYQLNYDANCGGCGIVCTNGTHCVNGNCMQNCTEDAVLCPDNTCIPRSTQNCAACGIPCLAGETCTNHQCVCPEGYGICEGACVELGTRSHCSSSCEACPAGYECRKYLQYGTCMMDCPYGYLNCGDGSCKNAQTDTANCGACGHACAAGQFCVNGTCSGSCPAGSLDCQNDGTCDNLMLDPRNCGGCGISCEGQQLCVNGVCGNECPFIPNIYEQSCYNIDVGGLVCSDRRTDPSNCGGCGRSCNLHQTCVDEMCVEACPAGTQYCDGAGCTNLGYDRNNCGYCGNRCGILCVWGECMPW
jgi:hypothetical protein